MTTQSHTPTPWRLMTSATYTGPDFVIGPDGDNGPVCIAEVEAASAPNRHRMTAPRTCARPNAAFIVEAVNNHERLQKTNDVLVEALEYAEKILLSYGTTRVGVHDEAVRQARAALKLAKGE